MAGFDFMRLLGSGLDEADEATLAEAIAELRRRIANGETVLDEFLEQVECRHRWKRDQRLDAEFAERKGAK